MLKSLKAMAKAVVSPLMDATGIFERRMQRISSQEGAWVILMYHRVIDDQSLDPFRLGMCVSLERYEQQVAYLSRRFNVLTVGDAVQRLAIGQPLPRRALSITFDDGYLDCLTRVLPVMKRYGAPFSVYVPTQGMATQEMLWWDRVITALACTRRTELDLQEVGLSSHREPLSFSGGVGAEQAEQILNRLWTLPKTACDRSVDLLERWLAPVDTERLWAHRLSPRQVRQLHQQGVEIGVHSASHPNLALADETLIRHELQSSQQALENLLQEPVRGFAYPGGRVGPAVQRMVGEQGFVYALGTCAGINRMPYEGLRLRRIGAPDASLPDFRRAVSGAMARTLPDDQLHF